MRGKPATLARGGAEAIPTNRPADRLADPLAAPAYHSRMQTQNLLITGGSRGIGAATARLAAMRGWDVAINYARDEAAAQAVAADVRALGRRALLLQADVGVETEVVAMFATLSL